MAAATNLPNLRTESARGHSLHRKVSRDAHSIAAVCQPEEEATRRGGNREATI
jgi:hypothetical protein